MRKSPLASHSMPKPGNGSSTWLSITLTGGLALYTRGRFACHLTAGESTFEWPSKATPQRDRFKSAPWLRSIFVSKNLIFDVQLQKIRDDIRQRASDLGGFIINRYQQLSRRAKFQFQKPGNTDPN
jgi:hypothetical protein